MQRGNGLVPENSTQINPDFFFKARMKSLSCVCFAFGC